MYGALVSHDMRTFFRDKYSDQASIVDFVVFGGHELTDYQRNRDVTKSKDKASDGLWKTERNDFGASEAPVGLDLV